LEFLIKNHRMGGDSYDEVYMIACFHCGMGGDSCNEVYMIACFHCGMGGDSYDEVYMIACFHCGMGGDINYEIAMWKYLLNCFNNYYLFPAFRLLCSCFHSQASVVGSTLCCARPNC
jgi:hypothetical protein